MVNTMFAILAMFSVIVLMGTPNAQAQPQAALAGKNVLILHTLETSTPLTVDTNRGLLDAFRIGGMPGANLFFESMDLRRNPSPEFRKLLVEQMRLKWTRRKADMVITVYPEALEFVLKDCRDVFPHVPIIALHLPQDFIMAETDRRGDGRLALDARAGDAAMPAPALTPQDLAAVAPEWLREFAGMLRRGRAAHLLRLIDQLPPAHAAVGRHLAELVRVYAFDKLLPLTEAVLRDRSHG